MFINKDRIVPVTATSLLEIYRLILAAAYGTENVAVVEADGIGEFEVSTGSSTTAILLNEPVVTAVIDSGVTAANIFFVPAYDFESITYGATTITPENIAAVMKIDPSNLMTAVVSAGSVTVTDAALPAGDGS